jgi:hypothetical protein
VVPPGNVVVVMDSGGLTFRVKLLLAVFINESVTVIDTLKLSVMVFVVPLIVPVKSPMLNPHPGGVLAAVHV